VSHYPWKILLVEDDEDDYLLVRHLLRQALEPGFQLQWANTYADALDALSLEPDVLLVDYLLGGHTGLELIKEVRQRGCKAPTILLTGKGNYKLDLAAMRAGVSDYLQKDELTEAVLERSIRYALERSRGKERLQQAHDQLEERVAARTHQLSEANARLEQANQALLHEIEERQQAQAAAELERQRLYQLMENMPALVSLISPDYSIQFTNEQFRQQIGSWQGEPCFRLFFQRQEPCESCPLNGSPGDRRPSDQEATLPGGRSLHLYAYPFTAPDGSPQVIELGIDITRRKLVEAELEHYNQELLSLTYAERNQRRLAEGLLEATTVLSGSLNLDDVLDFILEQTQAVIPCCAVGIIILEGEQASVVRRRGFEAYPQAQPLLEGRFRTEQIPLFGRMAATGEPVVLGDTWLSSEWFSVPGLEWVRSYAAAPLVVKGQVLGFLNILSDESNQFNPDVASRLQAFAAHAAAAMHNARLYKDLENAFSHEQSMRAQLIESEKFAAMGRMVASVAHELNNPLQTIKNCLFLLQEETPAFSSSHDYLNMAYSETQRLTNLVTQLRELYRPRTALALSPIAVNDLLGQVHALLENSLNENRVRWVESLGDHPVRIRGSADQVKQVFINICTNAIEAMKQTGGELRFSLKLGSEAEGLVGITVADTGPGISAAHLPHLFEPFFTTKSSGLGLGLSICYEIVDRHGGRLAAESPAGGGASFTIWLPKADAVPSAAL
jgi:signal transduction histidine kinase/DNA-binding response OmpR family regulator